jgi:hypothetical protein
VSAVARNGSDLCLQCGMCCDGTLFLHAPITPGEQRLVRMRRLAPDSDKVLDTFDLPCPAFLDGCCSLYRVERPHVCGAYRCRPLMEYEDGDTSLEEAAEVIRLVQALTHALEDEMGLAPGSFTRTALGAFLEQHDPHRHPDRYRGFISTLDRLIFLGINYFGYGIESFDETPTAAVPA